MACLRLHNLAVALVAVVSSPRAVSASRFNRPPRPNPAVNQTCAKSRAGWLLLR